MLTQPKLNIQTPKPFHFEQPQHQWAVPALSSFMPGLLVLWRLIKQA